MSVGYFLPTSVGFRTILSNRLWSHVSLLVFIFTIGLCSGKGRVRYLSHFLNPYLHPKNLKYFSVGNFILELYWKFGAA